MTSVAITKHVTTNVAMITNDSSCYKVILCVKNDDLCAYNHSHSPAVDRQ